MQAQLEEMNDNQQNAGNNRGGRGGAPGPGGSGPQIMQRQGAPPHGQYGGAYQGGGSQDVRFQGQGAQGRGGGRQRGAPPGAGGPPNGMGGQYPGAPGGPMQLYGQDGGREGKRRQRGQGGQAQGPGRGPPMAPQDGRHQGGLAQYQDQAGSSPQQQADAGGRRKDRRRGRDKDNSGGGGAPEADNHGNRRGGPNASAQQQYQQGLPPPLPPQPQGHGVPKKAPPSNVRLSDDEWKRKVMSLFSEWQLNRDDNEAILCLDELPPSEAGDRLVRVLVEKACDCGDSERKGIADIFIVFVKAGRLEPTNFDKPVFDAALEFMEDFIIDIPTIHTNLAQVLCPLMVERMIVMDTLVQNCEHLSREQANTFFKVMADFLSNLGEAGLAQEASQGAASFA